MPPVPHRPAALAWQVFRGSDALRGKLLTRSQLRGASWIHLCQDVYADTRLERDHALACRAVLLTLPAGTTIAGPSAAYLHGVKHAARFDDDVHVLVPRETRVRSRRGLRVHSTALGLSTTPGPSITPGSSTALGPSTALGLPEPAPLSSAAPVPRRAPVTPGASACGLTWPWSSPTLASWETAAWLEPVRAAGIIDTLLGNGLTTRVQLTGIGRRLAGRPGGRRAQLAFELVDPAAQSPPESHLRVRLVLAGLPRPVAQHPVRLPSGAVLHPDLVWPEFQVAVEYDGQWHADAEQLHHDRRRLNQLLTAGWIVLHVTSRRLRYDFPAVVREIRAALALRGSQC
ncbi:endonuclease domain-containing protein [Micromonospora sp. WMMA1923]|uniref:endonuclease domain-containing protein n=1 Tax=Micromonospora sp. WMMA1923 TaxID=3404125 RepID=UPI003B93587E